MLYRIRRVSPKSLGKLQAAIMGSMMVVFAVPIALVSIAAGAGVLTALVTAIFTPIGYGLMGYVVGVISAWVFNFFSKKTGGLQIELEPDTAPTVSTKPSSKATTATTTSTPMGNIATSLSTLKSKMLN